MDRIAFSLKMLVGTPFKDVFLLLVSRDKITHKKIKALISCTKLAATVAAAAKIQSIGPVE
jgi:hypothetical protein